MILVDDDDIARHFMAQISPARRPRSFLEFCHLMKLPDGPNQGSQFRPESEPAQLHFARAVDSGLYRRFVFVAPSQRGKTTLAILATWMYSIVEEGLDFGYVMPNLDKLSQNWAGKLRPGIVGSGFERRLPTGGPGSKGGRPAALTMTDPKTGKTNVSYFMAAGLGNRETSLSSVSPARIGIDEVDDFEDSGQIELALKRLESWGKKGRAYLASTVNNRKDRDGHPVLEFFGRSDATRSRVAHRCQLCGKFQVIRFDQLNLDRGMIACCHCGALWDDAARATALCESELVHDASNIVDGKIVHPNRRCDYFTLMTTIFDYHMGDFHSIAPAYVAAKDQERVGNYSLMENFSHKVLCEPYSIPTDHETVTDRALSLRSSAAKTGKGVCPDDADRIVVGVDVQGDRCYWVAIASGSRDRRWIIDWDEWFWTAKDEHTGRPIEPQDADRHAILERVVRRTRDGWPRSDGSVMAGSLVGIDIGFNPNGSIGRFCFGRAGIVPVRGDHDGRVVAESLNGRHVVNIGKNNSVLVSDHIMYEIRKQEASPGQPSHWWFIKSQSMREHASARLRLPYDSDGSMMLPFGIAQQDHLIQHLSAWAIVREQDNKQVKWVQVRKRDDYADATNYGLALLSQQPNKRSSGKAGSITGVNTDG